MSSKNKVFNFIQFSEINEGLEDELGGGGAPDANSGAPAVPPAATPAPPALPDASADPNAAEGAAPAEGEGDLEPGADGGPQIVKVYTDSEEDIQELKDNGIEIGGGEEGAEGEEGIEGQEGAPEDVLYIKIKTETGEDVILPFKEESEENRVEVEGEENTFDTELVATHNDFEFRVTAEIKVDPVTGEEQGKPEVEEGEPVEEQPADEEGSEGGEGQEPEAPVEGEEEPVAPAPNESFTFKQNILTLSQFINEGKREMENYKKAKAWEKALKEGKKKNKKKK